MTTEYARRTRLTILLTLIVVAGCGASEKSAEPHDSSRTSNDDDATDVSITRDSSLRTDKSSESKPATGKTDAIASSNSGDPAPETPKREPIYDPESDAEALISAAVLAAHRDNKRVLIEWGGNWCGWCYKLHDVFKKDDEVKPLVYENFELVLIDSGANRELMKHYGGADRQFSYPHLTVLGGDGNVLVNQNTEPLEEGSEHDPALVAKFLREWSPEPLNAQALLEAALERARAEDKHVLVHVGTPYCGWCKVLSAFLADHETLLDQDFVDLKIDTLRMIDGKAVADALLPGESRGVPWMVVVDSSGDVKATSVGPDGNCGYPVSDSEINHFLTMLTQTRNRMTDEDFDAIRADLEQYRIERDRRRKGQT